MSTDPQFQNPNFPIEMSTCGVGFRFRPTEEFLIKVLKRKTRKPEFDVLTTTEVAGDLSEVCMYGPGKEPWKLFSGADEILELNNTSDPTRKIREKYVITKLNRMKKKNVSRMAGKGYWLDKSKRRPVYDVDGEEVGHWRTLTYEYPGGDGEAAERRPYYYLNELHLSRPSDYVACRVMKNLGKECQGTKRCREDFDCPAGAATATKKPRRKTLASSEEAVDAGEHINLEEEEEGGDDVIDFSFLEEEGQVQEESHIQAPVCDTDLPDPELLAFFSKIQAPSTDFSSPAYVPDMSAILLQNQQDQVVDELDFDYPQLQQNWIPSSSSTLQQEWSEEELLKTLLNSG